MIDRLGPYPQYQDGPGWIGPVPAHWQVIPNRAVLSEVDERDHPSDEMLSVTIATGVIRQQTLLTDSSMKDSSNQDKTAYKLVRPGDIVYNKMRAWQGAVGESRYRGIVSPAYVVQRPRGGTWSRYLHFLLRTPAFAKEAERWSYGIASDMWSLRPEHFKMIQTCVPPVDEQAAIVRFLDYLDRRIRRYIGAKQKLIKLLEEQKQAVIHRAVTRGLDPDVRLKPSGVDWLGDVPAHWEVRTLGQVALSLRTGPFGSVLHQSDYVEGGIPLVNPTHMHDGDILEDRRVSVSPEVAERLSSYRLGKGDLVFSRRGYLGRCALVRDREDGWICGTGTIRVELDRANLVPEYLIEALQVPWVGRYLSLSSVGSTMANLNTGILKSLPTLMPPLEEQQELLNQIGAVRRRIGRAIGAARREITLIREYRTRLIDDVVTGKLDVREVAALLTDDAQEPEPLAEADTFTGVEDGASDDLDVVPEAAEA